MEGNGLRNELPAPQVHSFSPKPKPKPIMAAADIERAQSDLFLNPKKLDFFWAEVPEIPPAFADLLEHYSGVPPSEIREWILKNVRNFPLTASMLVD
jgi:hypothetical protein